MEISRKPKTWYTSLVVTREVYQVLGSGRSVGLREVQGSVVPRRTVPPWDKGGRRLELMEVQEILLPGPGCRPQVPNFKAAPGRRKGVEASNKLHSGTWA